MKNVDLDVVSHFGKEWKSYNQSSLSTTERAIEFNRYFSIFPWDKISDKSIGFDASDRFGTKLEKCFTKIEVEKMMRKSGLTQIKFSSKTPYYCAVGIKK